MPIINGQKMAWKASIDPAALDRIDPSQVNIMPNLDRSSSQTANGNSAMHSISNMPNNHYGQIPMTAHHGQNAINSMMYPIFPHQMPPPVSTHAMSPILAEAQSGPSSSDALVPGQVSHPPVSDGMNTHTPALHRRTSPGAKNDAAPKKSSCCGSSSTPSQSTSIPSLDSSQATHVPQPSPGMIIPGIGPQGQTFAHFYPHPTVFTYPPHYGSYLQPLLPELWKQAMDTMMAQGLGSVNPMPSPNFNYMAGAAPSTPLGTSHICTCGDGCQCVGCAAHPYNDATQNYVRSAWNMMMEDSWANGVNSPMVPQAPPSVRDLTRPNGVNPTPLKQEGGCCGNGSTSSSASPVIPTQTEGLNGNGTNSAVGSAVTTTTSPKASPTPQTPASDTTSGTNDEQILSANDFFFVTYPLSDSCVGDTASCPCGDDCQCLGCVVHGNNPIADSSAPTGA
ncbi:hypothetical protein jhhlp_003301 [Lomentospora prolificans]|uniref:Copper-fist domain-containing protein n=1 Tax=Lomentospora prolificans TaxID=41688 RepID=A0A2N3NGE1_9PEZI|nr:hypothetical protein jhhlp_003301 [Lomentospora prolificans]